MPAYIDMHSLSEDDRIHAIGTALLTATGPVAVIVDAELGSEKLNRYVRKLIDRFPGVQELDRYPGPTMGAETARMIGPKFDPKKNKRKK
jgi:calcineurin-like phosphoesterase